MSSLKDYAAVEASSGRSCCQNRARACVSRRVKIDIDCSHAIASAKHELGLPLPMVQAQIIKYVHAIHTAERVAVGSKVGNAIERELHATTHRLAYTHSSHSSRPSEAQH